MKITEVATGKRYNVVIEPVTQEDYKRITKARYFFSWKDFKNYVVLKLTLEGNDDILGLIALENLIQDLRVDIKLLAVSRENVSLKGGKKKYDGIAGCLIAYTCERAVKLLAEKAYVSLKPKTTLKDHYIETYGMVEVGKDLLCLFDMPLLNVISKYR